MTAPRTRTHITKLPAELRLQIYEYALAREEDHPFACSGNPTGDFRSDYSSIIRPSPMPPLLRVNRQIRAEALPVFYSQTTFVVVLPCMLDDKTRSLSNWLAMVGDEDAASIKKFAMIFIYGLPWAAEARKRKFVEMVGLSGGPVPYGAIRVAYDHWRLSQCSYVEE